MEMKKKILYISQCRSLPIGIGINNVIFGEVNSLLLEARLFGWLMTGTPQWDSNPGPWNKAPSRQQYMTNALTN